MPKAPQLESGRAGTHLEVCGLHHLALCLCRCPAPVWPWTDIRLRVRAEYCEHGPALEQGVASRRPQALARQLDVFGQATAVLRSRDLGSVVCDIKFSELSYLDAFWGDYLSGALLQALRGVFLTEALREAVGREAVRLLVSVDEADYEAGRRRLLLMEEEGGRRPTQAS